MSANTLKITALITMTIDHIGLMLFEECEWMRIVGRLAFPIFAFMIAEGCKHTHNRLKYILQIACLGLAMQAVFFIATGSLYQSVFISFSLAIALIYLIDIAKAKKKVGYWICAALAFLLTAFLCLGLPEILHKTDYGIDYSLIGILIPVVCYFANEKKLKLLLFSVCLVALSFFCGGIQWYCLLSIPLIALYNYKRGKYKLKYLFYIYYPLHLCVIFAVALAVNGK